MKNKLHVKTGDLVMILSGKDKGKKGKILATFAEDRKVLVEGISMAKRHTKPRRQGQEGGILKKETPIYASKVMRVCNKCDKPARTGFKFLDSGEKVRYCKKCDEMLGE